MPTDHPLRDPAWLAQAQDCFDKHVRYSSHTGYREAVCEAFATLLATVDTAAREEGRAALEAAETPLKVRAFDWLRNRHCPHYEGEPSHWPPEWVESLATLLAAIDTAAEARGREAEREANVALVAAILDRSEAYRWSLQGFGMLRLYLGDGKWRLHIWDSHYAVPNVSPIHDHPWDFTSSILAGRLTNRRYVLDESGEPHQHARLRPGVGGGLLSVPVSQRLRAIPPEHYEAGQVYTQRRCELHATEATPGTVTLCRRTRHAAPDEASVYWKTGPWVSAEPRDARLSEVQSIVLRAQEALRTRPTAPARREEG